MSLDVGGISTLHFICARVNFYCVRLLRYRGLLVIEASITLIQELCSK